ncbi:MAG: HPr kinase/phosphorylase PtsK [Rhodobacteraceae bacterium HLUCCA12]|nr:MAG: HPr kinase/phosphorylase PtsK [Rhodobacteraceae bacterium HLUCCA12]
MAFGPQAGILITGPSGSGKTALALALIAQGAQLVADDQTLVCRVDDALYARAPRAIAGLMEVRGMGLARLNTRRLARLRLVIDLGEGPPQRLPPAQSRTIAGVALALLHRPSPRLLPLAIRHYMMALERDG